MLGELPHIPSNVGHGLKNFNLRSVQCQRGVCHKADILNRANNSNVDCGRTKQIKENNVVKVTNNYETCSKLELFSAIDRDKTQPQQLQHRTSLVIL